MQGQQNPNQMQRHPISLNHIDTSQSLLMSQQPLSPTHATSSSTSSQLKQSSQEQRQQQLCGFPQLVGLTSLEYSCDQKFSYQLSDITQHDTNQTYLKHLYDENEVSSILAKAHEQFYKIDVLITLPCDIEVEQVEMQISNIEVFGRYLKLLKIEKTLDETQSLLELKSGFQDNNKRILELNSYGVAQQLRLTFLCHKSVQQLIKQDSPNKKTSTQQQIRDKIKNEIIPFLSNAEEDDLDELDDEVAMISNKKTTMLNTEDIKIEIQQPERKPTTIEQEGRNPSNNLNTNEDPDNTRNFNSMPRNYSESQAKKDPVNQVEIQLSPDNWQGQLVSMSLSKIKVVGFNCNNIPAITCMTTFMNHSFQLKKNKLMSDAFEIDFLVGVQLISTKRYTQASEVFRKIQTYYLKQIEENQFFIQQAQNKQINKQQQTQLQVKKFQTNKLFLKCAILELLIAESMCLTTQINDKLLSLKRMADLSHGKLTPQMTFAPQIFVADDPYTTITRSIPQMLKFLLMCMAHKKEIVKMAALKVLEFVLETLGCSLDAAIVLVLKAIIKTYPLMYTNKEPTQAQPLQQDSFCASALSSSASEYFASPRHQADQNANKVSLKNKFLTSSKQPQAPKPDQLLPTEYVSIKEPNSGFPQALKNLYNHVLETYISVLSSISSHILHQLFYEIIIPTLTVSNVPQNQTLAMADIKAFTIKIAEKIITICQGDLILNKDTLECLLQSVIVKSPQNESYQQAMKNLWNNIRQKVFTNYSSRGLRTLIEWVVEKMSVLAQAGGQMDTDSNSDIAKLEINDQEQQQLQQMLDIVSLISVGRKKNDEEANSLIKIKQEYCIDLYLLINPLLFWLDFSVEREDRLNLFKQVYQTIKDVLDNLPPKKVDIDILQIMIPILQRTTEYLKNNSPSLSMMKFLDLVLGDIKQGNFSQSNPDLQYFFLDMLNNFVPYLSYCLYDNAFTVFDKILAMCSDVINEKVVTKCITALVDKYTMKSKPQKNSLSVFMKCLMEVKVRNHTNKQPISNNHLETDELNNLDEEELSIHSKNNYFDILCEFCFFNNEDVDSQQKTSSQEFRNPIDLHDMYIDKLQFFIDSLSLLNELHVNMFTALIAHPKFKQTLLGLLNKGETSLRLKCHEILEIITNYYSQYCTSKTVYELAVPAPDKDKRKTQNEMMEVEFINHERLYVSQIVVQCVRASLEQKNDSYLQFNSLILLDFLFQNLLPVPSYQNEQLKGRRPSQAKSNQNQSSFGAKSETALLDIETLEISEETPEFEVTEQAYINMRLNLVFKLWPYVQSALNSAWSNIRSICYGLICSMLKIDIRDYSPTSGAATSLQTNFLYKLKQIVLPMLMSLLSSKESESKAGGLNILGSFCGLSYDFSKVKISKNLDFFKKNSAFISLSIWQLVFDLQDDWDITIKEASVVLIQLCAPRDAVKYFDKVKKEKESIRLTNMLSRFGMGPGSNGQGFHSQQSSRSQMYLGSGGSNEHEEPLGTQQDMLKKNNILSFLSGTDEMSMVFSMEQQYPGLSNDLFQQLPNSNFKLSSNRNKQRVLSNSQTSEDIDQHQKKLNILDSDIDGNFAQEIADINLELTDTIEQFLFFVDEYQDEQIQEIISIFRNDFKPPKNLWIEKNPSAAFNSPDYYQEIYSQAIEQYNQQQLQLQQKQQQELQLQVSNSPKTGVKSGSNQQQSLVDEFEDDLMKMYSKDTKQSEEQKDNYMIFERHFEDESELKPEQSNIDAEPYKFLDSEPKPQTNTTKQALQIIDEDDMLKEEHLKNTLESQDLSIKEVKSDTPPTTKGTDELIEEYERKINKTIMLLEEEKMKVQGRKRLEDTLDIIAPTSTIESNSKSTPEFKSKKEINLKHDAKINNVSPKDIKNAKKQAQQYLAELSKGQLSNLDNIKLMKQINNCFNDNSLGYNTQTKAKLNKSYENLLAANKSSKHQTQEMQNKLKKNLSSSPKRASSSSKKSGSSKSVGQTKRKVQDVTGKTNAKAMNNLRDLNYFIKTIEKDLSDKFSKLNMKDFNSMPTTPTSILRKVEEQVKAIAENKDKKNYMSNTCPNMAQVLSQINDSNKYATNPALSSNATPSNVSSYTTTNMSNGGYSQNALNNPSTFAKLSFSKTQKIDFKDAMKNMFTYGNKDGHSNRESSQENKKKDFVQLSPHRDERQQYANLMNSKRDKPLYSKKSRGSLDKYSSNPSSKLNKSANAISVQSKKSSAVNKSMVSAHMADQNLTRSSQKSVHQLLMQKLQGSQAPTVYQTPAQNYQHSLGQQFTFTSNQGFEYDSGETRKHHQEQKTPQKFGAFSKQGGGYSEIIELSPSSGEKPRQLLL